MTDPPQDDTNAPNDPAHDPSTPEYWAMMEDAASQAVAMCDQALSPMAALPPDQHLGVAVARAQAIGAAASCRIVQRDMLREFRFGKGLRRAGMD